MIVITLSKDIRTICNCSGHCNYSFYICTF